MPDPDPAAPFDLEPDRPPRLNFLIARGADRRFREVPVVRLRRRFARREHENKCSSDSAACGANLPVIPRSDSP